MQQVLSGRSTPFIWFSLRAGKSTLLLLKGARAKKKKKHAQPETKSQPWPKKEMQTTFSLRVNSTEIP